MQRSPHILFDARFREHCFGGDRCRFELAKALTQVQNLNVTYLTYEELQNKLPACKRVSARHLPEAHPWSDIFEHIEIPLISSQLRCDIYHGTFNVLPLMSGAPNTIVTIHDMAVFAFPEAYSKKFVSYMRMLIQRAIKCATKIITVSDVTQSEISRYFPGFEEKMVTIHNGVGEEFHNATKIADTEISRIKQKYGLTKPYVLFVGNLERKKNLSNLLRGFEKYCQSGRRDHQLVIVGKPLDRGPNGGYEIPVDNDLVRFTGYVEDEELPTLYRGADLIAYPSLYEGFGMPVLEGMAAGIPVLTSNVSSLPEVANGAAMLVDPTDVESIAQGLHVALSDKNWRETAINDGFARARQLTWAANAQATARVYEELLSRR